MLCPLPITNNRTDDAAHRRAMSLLETVAVMGANVVLVAAALSLLMTYIRADRQLAARDERMLQLSPMMKQVRDDLRGAETAHFSDQTLTLQMLAGGEASYHEHDGAWQRLRSENGAAELAGAYRLPAGSQLAMSPTDAAAGDVVRVEWSMPAEVALPNRPLPPAEELVVAVGRDGRLLHP
jgi:type II secretory pathway component PulJ